MSHTECPPLSELKDCSEFSVFNVYQVERVDGSYVYEKLKEFSFDENVVYIDDEMRLDCYHNCTLLLSSIQSNIHAFNSGAMRAVQDYSFRKRSSDQIRTELDVAISGLLFNFLNSARAFIDQTEAALCRVYGGKDSVEFKAWKAITGKAFDSGLAYGFFDKLRNYCQHVGVPVFIHSATHNPEKNTTAYKLEFDRDDLLLKYSGWGKTADKLRVAPQYFSVFQLMSDWAGSFNEISKYIHRFWYEYAVEAACRIQSYRKELYATKELVVGRGIERPGVDGWQRIPRFLPEAKARKVIMAYAAPVYES